MTIYKDYITKEEGDRIYKSVYPDQQSIESREGAIRSERTKLVTEMLFDLGIRYDRIYNSGDISNLFLSNMHKIEELVNNYNKLK
jgi:hypothetical protein